MDRFNTIECGIHIYNPIVVVVVMDDEIPGTLYSSNMICVYFSLLAFGFKGGSIATTGISQAITDSWL